MADFWAAQKAFCVGTQAVSPSPLLRATTSVFRGEGLLWTGVCLSATVFGNRISIPHQTASGLIPANNVDPWEVFWLHDHVEQSPWVDSLQIAGIPRIYSRY